MAYEASNSENGCLPVVMGRKNRLLSGHPQAAESRLRSWSRQYAPSELELGSERLLNRLPDRCAESHRHCIRQNRREGRVERSERATTMPAGA